MTYYLESEISLVTFRRVLYTKQWRLRLFEGEKLCSQKCIRDF